MTEEGLGTRRKNEVVTWEVSWNKGCFESSGFWEYPVGQVQPSVQRSEGELCQTQSRPIHDNLLLNFQ